MTSSAVLCWPQMQFASPFDGMLYAALGINAELVIDHAWGWEPTEIKTIKSYKPETNSFSSGQVLMEPYGELYQSTWEEGTLFVDEESVRVLPTQDNLNPDTPALNFMKYAVCDEPVLCLKTPNLGTVRHIKCKDIAEHPSEEYLAFLRDVYNIM